jgi:hypothetical protein
MWILWVYFFNVVSLMNVEPKNVNAGNFHINLQSSHTCVLRVGFPLHISGFKLQRLMRVA